jgi:hypothetical protein
LGGYGIDEQSLSEEAAIEGWIVDQNGLPKCKRCKRKKS